MMGFLHAETYIVLLPANISQLLPATWKCSFGNA